MLGCVTVPYGRGVTFPDPKMPDFVKKALLSIEFIGVLGNAWDETLDVGPVPDILCRIVYSQRHST